MLIDSVPWDRRGDGTHVPPFLDGVQRAVVDGEQIRLGYEARDGTSTDRVVHPLGVVAKGSVWYLIADTGSGMRTFRVDRMTAVEPTGDAVVKPPEFDLAATWLETADRIDEMRVPVTVTTTVDASAVRFLRFVFGRRLAIGGADTGSNGRVGVHIRGHNIRGLAAEIAGFGAMVEVVEPVELREALAAIGRELTACYDG